MAIIQIYKYVLDDDGVTEKVYRYTIPNLETFNVQYNTPISPMPLPEEDADENILVKIEGNSASIDIDWTLAQNDYTIGSQNGTCHFEEWNSNRINVGTGNVETLPVKSGDQRGKFDPVGLTFHDMEENTQSPSKQVGMFRTYFESKSLNNDYLITVEDGTDTGYGTAAEPTRWYGSISQMSFNISGSSPIVWRSRIQFFVGNVITVFDPDSPESPQNLSGVSVTGDESVDGSGNYNNNAPWEQRHVIKVRFQDPSSFGATDINEVEIMYRLEGKLNWTNVKYNLDTGTDGDEDKLEKLTAGSDTGYYVVYLPPNVEGTDGVDNYNLDSDGHFDTATYQGNGTPPANYTLSDTKFYTIKVHFRNTSGDGGFATDTVQTKTNPTP